MKKKAATSRQRSKKKKKKPNSPPPPVLYLNPTPIPTGANFPNCNIRELIRRRAREGFREAAAATEGGASSSASPADVAFSAVPQRELGAAKRQAALARLFRRPQRSVMNMMGAEEHPRREAGRGRGSSSAITLLRRTRRRRSTRSCCR